MRLQDDYSIPMPQFFTSAVVKHWPLSLFFLVTKDLLRLAVFLLSKILAQQAEIASEHVQSVFTHILRNARTALTHNQ